jgi:outer membrane lipoprotein
VSNEIAAEVMPMRPAALSNLPALICLAALSAATLSGCATTDCVSAVGRTGLTPAQVAASRGYTGERQRWGGTLASARNLADSTELEVIGYPLNGCGQPRTGAKPVGRFILVNPGYLETAEHPPGTPLTATGIIAGTREGNVGGASYRFPLLTGQGVRWWQRETQGTGTYRLPWVSIGIGGGSGGVGGGIGVQF